MLSRKYDMCLLKKLLVKDTPLIYLSITFDAYGNCGVSQTEGKVKYIDNNHDRLIWVDSSNPKRTLMLKSFGQLVPGFNYNNITFYGLFFPQGCSLEILLESAKVLYSNILRYSKALETTINTISSNIEERNTSRIAKNKIKRYREHKRFIKFGGDWLKRPYHEVKNDSNFNMLKLYGERKPILEHRRAYKLFDKEIKKDNFKIKYPKLYKKFIEATSVESKVLKKDRWKV